MEGVEPGVAPKKVAAGPKYRCSLCNYSGFLTAKGKIRAHGGKTHCPGSGEDGVLVPV